MMDMSVMEEGEIIDKFVDDIDTYPFKTKIEYEVSCSSGRIDIHLPEYDVVIEAKSAGDMKKAVGQALFYSESTDCYGYILIPVKNINENIVNVCNRSNIGIITTTRSSLNFSIVNDVGGFESFYPKHFTEIESVDFDQMEERSAERVGGF